MTDALTAPAGDPDGVRAAASALNLSSEHIDVARVAVGVTAARVDAGWMSAASQGYQGQLASLQGVMWTIPAANSAVAKALHTYADALERTQRIITRQSHRLDEAIATHAREVAAARQQEQDAEALIASLTTAGPAGTFIRSTAAQEIAVAQGKIATADQTLQQTETDCKTRAAEATMDCTRAAAAAERAVQSASRTLGSSFVNTVTDIIEAAAAVGTVFVTGLSSADTVQLVEIARTLHSGDAVQIAALDSDEFAEAEKLAVAAGPNSARALAVWLDYQGRLVPAQLAKIGHAIDGLDPLAEATTGGARLVSVLGKLGLATGVIADLTTLLTDHDKTDRWLAAFNLAGATEAAGEPVARGLLADLTELDVSTDAIPYVGEVVMLGTALAMGGKFVVDNWTKIEHLAGEVNAAARHVPGVAQVESVVSSVTHPESTLQKWEDGLEAALTIS